MLRFKNYEKVESLGRAYELNQKKSNMILGGMLWLKMQNIRKQTAIDLSGLNLNGVAEEENQFRIGCMCTLRELETNQELNQQFGMVFQDAFKHIIGVQFRNCATIGGSVFGRFGFSDVLTLLLALDSYVELYPGGVMPLEDFVKMPKDHQILTHIIIKKDGRSICYHSERHSSADFPIIACAVSCHDGNWTASIGARPAKASKVCGNQESLAQMARESLTYGTNMRGSEEYRRHLAGILVERGIQELIRGGKVDHEA